MDTKCINSACYIDLTQYFFMTSSEYNDYNMYNILMTDKVPVVF